MMRTALAFIHNVQRSQLLGTLEHDCLAYEMLDRSSGPGLVRSFEPLPPSLYLFSLVLKSCRESVTSEHRGRGLSLTAFFFHVGFRASLSSLSRLRDAISEADHENAHFTMTAPPGIAVTSTV